MSAAGGQLKKYKRLKYLGKGSYGAAILVELRSDPKQKFVIKEIVIGHLKEDEQAAARKEAEVLHQMQHSNITMYVESFVENSKLYIVMEHADGGDLATMIAKRKKTNTRWSENEIMRIFVQICLALKHVHEHNILHRDLKSQNIFLTSKGLVKLGDFGIAKVLDSTEDQARTQIGTPYYLSPEICESLPYGRQSDIWSLGVVLFELLTFELPFQAQSLPALIRRICSQDPAFDKIHSSYGSNILGLVRKLLKRNPSDRPTLQQVVSTDFFKAHICKLLSHTLKVGTGGVQSEQIDHDVGRDEDESDEHAALKPLSIDPEEVDRNIEKARKKQQDDEAMRRRVQANAEREAQRQEEREKLRKFRENMARNVRNNSDARNEIVIANPQRQLQHPPPRQEQHIPRDQQDQRSLIQQQEERIRELERQVQEQQKRSQWQEYNEKQPNRPMVSSPHDAVVHSSPSRRSLLDMQQRGEIEIRKNAPQVMQPPTRLPDKRDEQDIVRQQFFDNRAAAAAVKARVEAEQRGYSFGEHAVASHAEDRRAAPSEQESKLDGEARVAMIRANRDRTKEAEREERDRQLKLAYQINREERRLLAERANAKASNLAFEIQLNTAAGEQSQDFVESERPNKSDDSTNEQALEGPRGGGLQLARGHFYRDDNDLLRPAKLNEASHASKPIYDRSHLDDDITDGKDNAVLQKLHDRRKRDIEARENARVVFRRLQEQRRKQAEQSKLISGRQEPRSVLKPHALFDEKDEKAQDVPGSAEDEHDLEQNINTWLSRQHNDFLRNKKVAQQESQQKESEAKIKGDNDDAENQVADLQVMLANALLANGEKVDEK